MDRVVEQDVDRAGEIVGVGRLPDEADGAGLHRVPDARLVVRARDDDDRCVRVARPQPVDALEAVIAGHGQIEQDHVGVDASHQLEQVVAAHRGARDLEARSLHSHLQCLQEKRMIIR